MMNTCNTICLEDSVPAPQHLTEALGRLKTQKFGSVATSIYTYDLIEQRTFAASCSIATMLGYSAEAIDGMGTVGLGKLIHPNDLKLVFDHYQRFTTLRANDVIMLNYRMKQADGTWCLLHSQETPLITAIDGFPLQILGIVQRLSQFSDCLLAS